ncbi:MAG TPA: hypothetical protein VIJ12_04095 [Candidatus Baltobacteraceae bacterium]
MADQQYTVSGVDAFTVGSQPAATVSYSGAERLHVDKRSTGMRFEAEVRYTRSDDVPRASARGRFVQYLVPSGTFEDRIDDDPDFLTILNQPFAVWLDAATLRDLRGLHGSVPFRAASPVSPDALVGTMRRGPTGSVDGIPAVGVRFAASGPMHGDLPGHPGAAIHGTVRMEGTAYYALGNCLLIALDARLAISGTLYETKNAMPVRIVYSRTIRAADGVAPWAEASR